VMTGNDRKHKIKFPRQIQLFKKLSSHPFSCCSVKRVLLARARDVGQRHGNDQHSHTQEKNDHVPSAQLLQLLPRGRTQDGAPSARGMRGRTATFRACIIARFKHVRRPSVASSDSGSNASG
jgi:hypothetical protein